jgi:hypothetical protein
VISNIVYVQWQKLDVTMYIQRKVFETQLTNQTFMVFVTLFRQVARIASRCTLITFLIHYLFAIQVLNVRNFNLMQVPGVAGL